MFEFAEWHSIICEYFKQEDGLSFGGRGSFDRFDVGEEVEDDEGDEEEEEDRSLDLLVQFVQNVFRKVSRRARKAVRSMLPRSIPSKLVSFYFSWSK